MKKSRKWGCGCARVCTLNVALLLCLSVAAQVARGKVTGPMAEIEDRGQWFESHADHLLGIHTKQTIIVPGSEIHLLRLLRSLQASL